MQPSDQDKHKAFAAALKELYRRYPLPDYKYPKVRWRNENDRVIAIRNARDGDPLFMIEMFAVKVPRDEIRAVHTLIYG